MTSTATTTIAIVGAGPIGGAAAYALALGDRIGRVALIEEVANVAAGKALDIRQAGAIAGFHTLLEGTDDLSRVVGCSACIVADRFAEGAGEWRGEEGIALTRRLLPLLGDAPLVFAGTSQVEMLANAAAELGASRRRLIGSATVALASSMAALTAMEADCSADDVRLTVLGVPPAFVVPWSEASIAGYALDHVLAPIQRTRVEARSKWLWPPGPYALGAAAARTAEAMLTASRRTFSIITQLQGEFGVKGRPGVLPVRLGPHGIAQAWVPELTTRERVLLETALGG